MARPGLAFARSTIVGARSALIARLADLHPPRDARPAHQERHPDRLLVDALLFLGDPVLAVEVAVVGGVDQDRVAELALRPQRVDDLLDALVHREQGFQLAAVLALDVRDLIRGQARAVADLGRLVGDVGLVEVRGPRQRLGVERVGVARRRLRGVLGSRTAGSGSGPGRPVGRRVGEPEEEWLRKRRPAVDEVDRLSGQHVLLEVGGVLAVVDQGAVLVQRCSRRPPCRLGAAARHSDQPGGTGGSFA